MTDIDKLKREICAMQPVPSMVDRLIQAVEAAYQASLRQGVELPEPAIYADNGVEGYTQDQLQQYGDARDQAGYLRGLETALLKVTGLSVDTERCKQLQLTTQAWEEALDAAANAIEQLKVK